VSSEVSFWGLGLNLF